jgi:flavin reductase (DIM6/NTAB) family NADH-FMN oxidoreductase RutF
MVYGITVSSFTSLSLDPPLVLVCVAHKNRLSGMIRDAGAFAVSLLAAEQSAASSYFSKSGREPLSSWAELAGIDEDRTTAGMPVLRGAMAFVCCALHSEVAVGDHNIVIGRVVEARAQADREPLLYHRRRYRTIDGGRAIE